MIILLQPVDYLKEIKHHVEMREIEDSFNRLFDDAVTKNDLILNETHLCMFPPATVIP